MITRYKAPAHLAIAIGLPLDLIGFFAPVMLRHYGHPLSHAAGVGMFAMCMTGRAILSIGYALLAMAKGRSPAWGISGMLLSVIALIPLSLLLDRSENEASGSRAVNQ